MLIIESILTWKELALHYIEFIKTLSAL